MLVWTPKAALVSTIFSCAVESPAFLLSICSVFNGNDCRRDSLRRRKLALRQLLEFREALSGIYVDHIEAEGTALYSRICELISKASLPSTKISPIPRKAIRTRASRHSSLVTNTV